LVTHFFDFRIIYLLYELYRTKEGVLLTIKIWKASYVLAGLEILFLNWIDNERK